MRNLVFATAAMVLTMVSSVFAYTVDGMIASDWGVNLFASGANAVGYLNTHLPTGENNVEVVTEDNAGPQTGWQYVGPGYTYYGNQFDVEAIYFDNNAYNAYLAVITGFPISGATAPGNPWFTYGDIGIDADNNGTYEYGIDISTYNAATGKAALIGNAGWNNVYYPQFGAANPFTVVSGTNLGLIDFVYSGNQNTHYVLEAGIPLTALGLNGNTPSTVNIHWTMECGNDYLVLKGDVSPVPEPATMSLLGLGLLGLLGLRKKK
jgi:hypothetical protein